MNKESVVAQLNKLLTLDRALTEKFVGIRHPVSKDYTNSGEFIYMQETEQDTPVAGFIGILNGLLDNDDIRIAAQYEDEAATKLVGFVLIDVKDFRPLR